LSYANDIDFLKRHAGRVQSRIHDGTNIFYVAPAGQLRYDPAILGVNRMLRGYDVGTDVCAMGHDGDCCVITRGFDT
jgi:hypothetical protein